MKITNIIAMAISTLIISSSAMADLDGSMDELCAKMKTCALGEVKKQGLPAGMEQMMVGMMEGMCTAWVQPYSSAIGQAGLEDKAEACVESVVSQSCDSLMAQSQDGPFTSAACKEFEAAADEAGVDLKNIN